MKTTWMLVLVVLMNTSALAQKLKVTSGDFNFLMGQTELNLVMDYSSMRFYKENMDENRYIQKRSTDILSSGKGHDEVEVWLNDWERSKSTVFPEEFMDSLSKNSHFRISQNNENAPYTLIVQTIWIYPGWFAGVESKASKLNTVLKFVATDNPNEVLLEITSDNATGNNLMGIANNNSRISKSYAKTGKSLAKLLKGKI